MDSQSVLAAFRERYPDVEPTLVASAPGRINLIGENTDYNDGFVFPAAIDRGVIVAAARVNGPSKLTSLQLGPAETFDTANLAPGQLKEWAQYAAGMAWTMRSLGSIPNIAAVVDSTLPIGSGVSSSAAMEL